MKAQTVQTTQHLYINFMSRRSINLVARQQIIVSVVVAAAVGHTRRSSDNTTIPKLLREPLNLKRKNNNGLALVGLEIWPVNQVYCKRTRISGDGAHYEVVMLLLGCLNEGPQVGSAVHYGVVLLLGCLNEGPQVVGTLLHRHHRPVGRRLVRGQPVEISHLWTKEYRSQWGINTGIEPKWKRWISSQIVWPCLIKVPVAVILPALKDREKNGKWYSDTQYFGAGTGIM